MEQSATLPIEVLHESSVVTSAFMGLDDARGVGVCPPVDIDPIEASRFIHELAASGAAKVAVDWSAATP
jgi:hypothetical protein